MWNSAADNAKFERDKEENEQIKKSPLFNSYLKEY